MLSAASGSGGRGGGVPSSVSAKNKKRQKLESQEGVDEWDELRGEDRDAGNTDQNCNHWDRNKEHKRYQLILPMPAEGNV